MNIKEIIKQPEGRRLELKEQLPIGSNLAKTVIAFSNDAGGEIYLGVKDEPSEYVGLDPDTIIQLEEQISSMIFDQCAPVILPEFTIITHLRHNELKTISVDHINFQICSTSS